MDKIIIRNLIAGNPKRGIAGLQDDWWTYIAPDIWNSKGSYLRDECGDEYLDLCGFFGTAVVSFDHPKIRDESFLSKIAKVAMYRPSLSDFWTRELAEFVQTFREIATPSYMHHFFFIEGGALAVENALKAAFDWKVRLNIKKGKISEDTVEVLQPLGTKVLFFENAFHGRSGYTLSMTHTADPRKYKYFPKFNWFRINPPVLKFDADGKVINKEEVQEHEKKATNEINSIIEQYKDDIAAIIIEPVQCEGGDRHIPETFFKYLRKVSDQNDIILIYDEVQTGMGITGRMWMHEYFGDDARPDVLCFGKKTQISGIMANYDVFSRIDDNVFSDQHDGKSRLNSTWGSNPVDMIRCKVLLEIIQEDNLLDNANKIGNSLLKGICQLAHDYQDYIENPRGRGLLIAFDAVSEKLRDRIWKALYDEKLLCLTCGRKTIRLRPHLDITESEVGDAITRVEKALKKIAGEGK